MGAPILVPKARDCSLKKIPEQMQAEAAAGVAIPCTGTRGAARRRADGASAVTAVTALPWQPSANT